MTPPIPSSQFPAPRSLFAGIDGGGTKTEAVVVDETGRERGRARAGSSNVTVVGHVAMVAALTDAVREATRQAGATPPLAAAWFGLAGVDRPAARERLRPHLTPLAADVTITNDAELVLAALPDAVGVAIIAGTGSIQYGRDPAGLRVRAGGWGHVFGDEGSGYELGRAALQAAVRGVDARGPETALLPAILAEWSLESPFDLIGHVYEQFDKPAIAALSHLVFTAAAHGDAVARAILRTAATELAGGALAVAGRLAFPDGPIPLALAGGLLTGDAGFRAMVVRRLRRHRLVAPVAVVADPALAAARAIAGVVDS